ncbi:MAG TPA: hypothetical protein DCP20_05250 [Coriobacteriia bacterium]|nr:hypothetical protein [Coriobacteriia bacterium]
MSSGQGRVLGKSAAQRVWRRWFEAQRQPLLLRIDFRWQRIVASHAAMPTTTTVWDDEPVAKRV